MSVMYMDSCFLTGWLSECMLFTLALTHAQFRHCGITESKIVYNVAKTLLFSILWTLSPVGTKKKYQSENSYVKGWSETKARCLRF